MAMELPAPPPSSAEAVFLASETQRQAALHARSHSILRQTTAGDDRRVLREIAERQAKRELDATCAAASRAGTVRIPSEDGAQRAPTSCHVRTTALATHPSLVRFPPRWQVSPAVEADGGAAAGELAGGGDEGESAVEPRTRRGSNHSRSLHVAAVEAGRPAYLRHIENKDGLDVDEEAQHTSDDE